MVSRTSTCFAVSFRVLSSRRMLQNHKAVGPWGGQYGSNWDDGVNSGVRQIVITHGAGIDAIQIEYDKQGNSVWSEKHGGIGGYKTDKVVFGFPEEYITSVHGYHGHLYEGGPVCVRSLTFASNEKRMYGPFGVEKGTYFAFPMIGHTVVGFHGKSGWYLDAIGAYLKPVINKSPSKSVVQQQHSSLISHKQGFGSVDAHTLTPKKSPKSLAHGQNYIASGAEKCGYSVIQGRIGNNYDVVVAIKQKESHPNSSPITFSRHSSSSSSSSSSDSSSDEEKKKEKIQALSLPKHQTSDTGGPITYGPWGGHGGSVFDDGVYTGIRQIYLSRNVGIVWIKALYEQNGIPVWGSRNGGAGGFKTDKIVFDYPYEVLTHITGFYGPAMLYGPTIIGSLTFHTTMRKYGPYGEEQGTPFSSNLKEGMIVGFHGRKGLFVDAIGVHVVEGKVTVPTHPPKPLCSVESVATTTATTTTTTTTTATTPTTSDGENQLWPSKHGVKPAPFEEIPHGIVKEPAPCGPGPWGGESGKPWDDGVYTGIRQVFVTRSDAICSIQIEYDRNGQSVWSVKHGGNSGTNVHRIKLEYPHEVLTCVSGYYGPTNRDDHHTKVIRSLTFYTSRGKFGPFGEEIGTFFTSTKTEGKVVGFHGRSGMYLDAIGVHMQHWLGAPRQSKSSFLKLFV